MKLDQMKKIIFLSITIIAFITLKAQSTATNDTNIVKRDIRIEKKYTPVLMNSRREDITLAYDTISVTKNKVNYSRYDKLPLLTIPFVPDNEKQMTFLKMEDYNKGYAGLGIGLPLNWQVNFWYPLYFSKTSSLETHFNHYGLYHSEKVSVNTDLGIKLNEKQNDVNYMFLVNYKNNHFSYYGTNSISDTLNYMVNDSTSASGSNLTPKYQTIHRLSLAGGFSTNNLDNWTLSSKIGYEMLYLQSNGLNEHNILLDAQAGTDLGSHRFNLILDLHSIFYAIPKALTVDNLTNNTTIQIEPSYDMAWPNTTLKLGAKILVSTNKSPYINYMPDIRWTYNFKDKIGFYAGITGDYKINNLSSIYEENRYFAPNEGIDKNTYTPFNPYAGFNLRPIKGMLLNINGDYRYIFNDYFYANKTYIAQSGVIGNGIANQNLSNVFTTVGTNGGKINLNARLSYNLKEKYYFYIDEKYHKAFNNLGDGDVMLYVPQFETSTGIKANIVKNMTVKADFYYASQRRTSIDATTPALQPIYDLNLSGSYQLQKNIAIFVRLNNILSVIPSMQYDNWLGYQSFGFYSLGGISISFK